MKVHKSLIIISAVNFAICLLAFFILDITAAPYYKSLNTLIGWMLWMGIFTLIAPLFLSNQTRVALYNRNYLAGTCIMGLVNFLAIVGACMAAGMLTS